MAAITFSTATKAETRVLSDDPARARVQAFEDRAQVLLKSMLPKPTDATPALRSVLQTLTGSLLSANERDAKLADALDHFAAIVERVPDLERRIAALEAKR